MADNAMQPDDTPELRALYQAFEEQSLMPLWTQRGDLMPNHPKLQAVPHVWKWAKLLPLAEASGSLIHVGRGGERRTTEKGVKGKRAVDWGPAATSTLIDAAANCRALAAVDREQHLGQLG